MDYKIYIFPTEVELERPTYPDISDNDRDSVIESYKKHTHMIMIILYNSIIYVKQNMF